MQTYQEIPVAEVSALMAASPNLVLLDVREENEYAELRAKKSWNLPLSRWQMPAILVNITADKAAPLYLICRSGRRSATACEMLIQAGYQNVYNVTGGILAWQAAGFT